MMRIYFYADEEDIANLALLLFCLPDVAFFKSYWIDGEQYQFCAAESMVENILVNDKVRMYFACTKTAIVKTEVLKLGNGKVLNSINHGVMPDSVRVFFGQRAGENFLTQSTIDGFCKTPLSMNLFKAIRRLVAKNSRKIGGVFVFAGAERKHSSGWILAPNREASPALYFSM